ncbi:MAG: phosphopentomutase [Bosea sp. (in: a-proteobacteria)]
MPRAMIIVLDSVGCGASADAAEYGDAGANTLGHIAEHCASGRADRPGLREGPLHVPHMAALGLSGAHLASTGLPLAGVPMPPVPLGEYGCAIEISQGKDTPSGHWEIAGCPVPFKWGYFLDKESSFPPELVAAIISEGNIPGILGNCHASGTAVIGDFGPEHMRYGKPICYTSVDSVFQIAAHEEVFGLQRLYDLCKVVRKLVDPLSIGRVIARPFVGTPSKGFQRTPNRKDFAIAPPNATILDRAHEAGRAIVTIGKIGDIFAHRNTATEMKGISNDGHFDMAVETMRTLPDGGFAFVNLVDFDTEYGHRRDVPGYAAALEAFDRRLPELQASMRPGDLVIITADHGNDPSWPGTDHTREHVPILGFGPGIAGRAIGKRTSFADIGQSVASHLGLSPLPAGTSWR